MDLQRAWAMTLRFMRSPVQELEVLSRRGWEPIGPPAFGQVVRVEPLEALELDLGFLDMAAAQPTQARRRTKTQLQ